MHINRMFIAYNNCRCKIFITSKYIDSDHGNVLQVCFFFFAKWQIIAYFEAFAGVR